jgi:hypothetical protein
VKCPVGATWTGSSCQCGGSNGYIEGNRCKYCGEGATWNGVECTCGNGGHWEGTSCLTCSSGSTWNGLKCECSGNTHREGDNCVECPKGSSWSGHDCACPKGMTLSGNQCTCGAGTSLRDGQCVAGPADVGDCDEFARAHGVLSYGFNETYRQACGDVLRCRVYDLGPNSAQSEGTLTSLFWQGGQGGNTTPVRLLEGRYAAFCVR